VIKSDVLAIAHYVLLAAAMLILGWAGYVGFDAARAPCSAWSIERGCLFDAPDASEPRWVLQADHGVALVLPRAACTPPSCSYTRASVQRCCPVDDAPCYWLPSNVKCFQPSGVMLWSGRVASAKELENLTSVPPVFMDEWAPRLDQCQCIEHARDVHLPAGVFGECIVSQQPQGGAP